ncbi:sensor histidine kinase [Mesobacillus zeae]|uniref:histidine kinase n=2 Tax=Mesobacillus zeae TaxID=1917180 RepID=A0A398B3L9_9BACI|nr:sensor histidine kinase [Mesobacillus zeae]
MPKKILIYMALMLAVPLAGEMKFYPLEGSLRISLGTPVFFFFLLWSRRINPVFSGLLAGIAVVVFRILYGIYIAGMPAIVNFELHFPVFFYYLSFAAMFHYFHVKSYYGSPFLLGLLGVVIEIFASIAELAARSLFIHVPFTLNTLLTISGIAIIRSFFVLGFFNIFVIREARAAEHEQRLRIEQMLMLISNLYVEMIQLKKMMKNSEELTSECYVLYRNLKGEGHNEHAQAALKIAGEMHETKKDSQRIYAGLSKLMAKEDLSDFLSMKEILNVVITSNERYSQLLGKKVHIQLIVPESPKRFHTFMILSIVNNLVSNAVEAIKEDGEIRLEAALEGDHLKILVKDTGTGIAARNRPHIFEPGFTTKFDQDGIASNGIGLSYVKNVIESLDGSFSIEDKQGQYNTVFAVSLPTECLMERG